MALIMFHGLGDTEQGAFSFAESLQVPDTVVVSLRGPLKMPRQLPGHMWINSFTPEGWYLYWHHITYTY